jgi:hypothetical protein
MRRIIEDQRNRILGKRPRITGASQGRIRGDRALNFIRAGRVPTCGAAVLRCG